MAESAFMYVDRESDWYGFSTKSNTDVWNFFNPSLFISPSRKILQLRYTDPNDNHISNVFDYSLDLLNEYTYTK